MYKVYPDKASAQAQADALWEVYASEQWTLRGLPEGSSLDKKKGKIVPAITVRYCEILEASGETQVALPVDAFVSSKIDTSDAVSVDDLPPALKDVIKPIILDPKVESDPKSDSVALAVVEISGLDVR